MNEEKKKGSRYKDEYSDLKVGSIIRDGVIVIILLAIISSGVYRINTGEGAILTEVSGQKVPITDVGWHSRFPLLTSLDSYSVVNNRIYFPSDLIQLETQFQADKVSGSIGLDIKTSDNK